MNFFSSILRFFSRRHQAYSTSEFKADLLIDDEVDVEEREALFASLEAEEQLFVEEYRELREELCSLHKETLEQGVENNQLDLWGGIEARIQFERPARVVEEESLSPLGQISETVRSFLYGYSPALALTAASVVMFSFYTYDQELQTPENVLVVENKLIVPPVVASRTARVDGNIPIGALKPRVRANPEFVNFSSRGRIPRVAEKRNRVVFPFEIDDSQLITVEPERIQSRFETFHTGSLDVDWIHSDRPMKVVNSQKESVPPVIWISRYRSKR